MALGPKLNRNFSFGPQNLQGGLKNTAQSKTPGCVLIF